MNYQLKHTGAYQFAPNYHPVEGAPHTLNDLSGFNNRYAREIETDIIPLSDPVFAPRPAFNQPQPVSFVSLSDRIASQANSLTSNLDTAAAFEPGGSSLRSGSVKHTVRTMWLEWLNPQSLGLTTMLALLAGLFVYYFVTG